MSTIKTNTLTGTTSAGVINVTGEGGSVTTNLQQGLCKAWSHHSGGGSVSDSFNSSHTTDHGSADNTFSFTAPMGNAFYSVTFGGGQNGSTTSFISFAVGDGLNPGSFRYDGGYHDQNGPHNYEWEDFFFQVQGDLA